jgi:hypothetical protein
MRTFTITFQDDQDADTLLSNLQTAVKFNDEIEILEMNEDSTEDDMDALDDSLGEFYEKPFDKETYENLQKEMSDNYGIKFILLRP